MKGKELSEEFRDKVVHRHKLGEGYKKISNALGISSSTVRSIIHKWRVYGTTQTLPRSGRPSKINSWAKRILALELTMRPNATLKELQTSMAEMGENVHRSTIARSFANCSRNGRSARKKPSKTNNNLESRMAFATKHLDYTSKTGKNPAKPRIKMSSYAYFVHTCREEHKIENPEASVNFSEFSKKCSERWKSMSAEEKSKFVDLAELDKVRSEMEMKSQLPPKGGKKTPNKSPPSAFFIFCDEFRPQVMEETPGISLSELAKKLGEKWNNLTAEDKLPYEKKAAKLKEKYEKGEVPVSIPTKAAAPAKDDDDDDDEDDDDDDDDDDDNDDDDDDDDDDNNDDDGDNDNVDGEDNDGEADDCANDDGNNDCIDDDGDDEGDE
ncbi:hypothetical protein UPYG_G00127900 [Umbra pygmaea]|uniref:HMG box domain-containing protein n=1 Tax=Umbra pygmaea TaxID=75934 RepID=A0ABD0X6G5_UMBPY